MDDSSKSDKKMPETPAKEVKDEKLDDSQNKMESTSDEKSNDKTDDAQKESEAKKEILLDESEKEEIKEEIGPDEKPKKDEKPTEKKEPQKKDDVEDDFRYIVRIANTDINGAKTIVYGLTSIKGIGMHMSFLIADAAGIDRNLKIGDLSEAQIEKLKVAINDINKNAPSWMLNTQKDYETGDDIHLISSDIDMRLRDGINIMKKIRSYRGIRHERGLPVRGQRTRANNRRGLTLGVSKKGVQSKKENK